MIRDNREATWPFLCALFCLFVLSIAAPRIWQRNIHIWSDGVSGIDEMGSVDSTSGQSTLSTWREEPKDDGDLAATLLSEGGAGLESAIHSQSAISRVGEMQLATPGPKYGQGLADLDWADLGLPDLVESSDQGDAPEESLDAEVLESEVLESEVLEDNRDMSLVEGVTVVLPEEIPLTGSPVAEPGGWSSGSLGWPEALFGQLDILAWNCETGEWARSTARQVRRLGRAMADGPDEAVSIVQLLDELALGAESLADSLEDTPLASDVRKAGRSLRRRTFVWRWVISAGGPAATIAHRGAGDGERIRSCLVRIDELLGNSAESSSWREFLALHRLEAMAAGADGGSSEQGWALALEVLWRLNQPGLTDQQREFIAGGPMAELQSELCDWVGGPVDLGQLMEHVERYEVTGSVGDARRLTRDLIRLQVSPVAEHRDFGQHLQSNYRRANVRIAVTEELLNRMIPPRKEEYQWMRDRVLGMPVSGHQWTDTDVAIHMVPDPRRLRMALEIDGLVSSLTSSNSGPATFHNNSESTYTAHKEMELNASGLHFQPAQVSVDNVTHLRSVRTDLDGIPLIASLAREIARSEHQKNRTRIKREVKQKVLRRAQRQIDEESEARLGKLSQRLTDRVVEPLNAMSIGPTMVGAWTDEKRMTMELRLAGNVQLGASTARPWAPSDSLASCQIHESALNNMVAGLELDGRTFTLAELRRHLADRFKRPELAAIETEHDDVSITFAESDAAQIQFEDGRIAIRLSVAKLRQSRRAWSNFQVLVYYRARVSGHSAELVRDGVIQLVGRQDFRSQIALRGIFSKTFSKQRPWQVLPERLANDPGMNGLCVTQLDLVDGWLGVALGPVRSGSRPSVAQRHSATAQ
jgi:hypothetical protein